MQDGLLYNFLKKGNLMKSKNKRVVKKCIQAVDSNDPLGIRKTILAGDTPSLHSELRFIRRQREARIISNQKETKKNERKC